MAKPDRMAIIWDTDEQKNYSCWYITYKNTDCCLGTPEKMLRHILKGTNYHCVSDTCKQKFIQDALNGRVLVAYGCNTLLEDSDKWNRNNQYYTTTMHKVDNVGATLYKNYHAQQRHYGGYGFQIVKTRPLYESEMNVIKSCQNIMKENDKVDQEFLLLQFMIASNQLCKLHNSYNSRSDYGRLDNNISFSTDDCITYKDSDERVSKVKAFVDKIYEASKDLTGYKLVVDLSDNNKIELPEVLLSSRSICSSALTAVKLSDTTTTVAEQYKYMLENEIIDKIIKTDRFDRCYILTDESICAIKFTSYATYKDEVEGVVYADSFKDIPDCIVIADNGGRVDYILAWGTTKDTIEIIGRQAFVRYAQTKQN